MKKIFSIVLIIAAMIAAASCATVSNVTNNPYEAEGYGVSMDRDIAYDKAFLNASKKLAEKYNFTVDYTAKQNYESEDYEKGKGNETLSHFQNTTGKAHVEASDIVVTKCKYRLGRGNKYTCELVVKVSPDNLR